MTSYLLALLYTLNGDWILEIIVLLNCCYFSLNEIDDDSFSFQTMLNSLSLLSFSPISIQNAALLDSACIASPHA